MTEHEKLSRALELLKDSTPDERRRIVRTLVVFYDLDLNSSHPAFPTPASKPAFKAGPESNQASKGVLVAETNQAGAAKAAPGSAAKAAGPEGIDNWQTTMDALRPIISFLPQARRADGASAPLMDRSSVKKRNSVKRALLRKALEADLTDPQNVKTALNAIQALRIAFADCSAGNVPLATLPWVSDPAVKIGELIEFIRIHGPSFDTTGFLSEASPWRDALIGGGGKLSSIPEGV